MCGEEGLVLLKEEKEIFLKELAEATDLIFVLWSEGPPRHYTWLHVQCTKKSKRPLPGCSSGTWSVTYMDPLTIPADDNLVIAKRLLSNIGLGIQADKLTVSASAKQADGWSCGLWCVMFTEQLLCRLLHAQLPSEPSVTTLNVIERTNEFIEKVLAAAAVEAKRLSEVKENMGEESSAAVEESDQLAQDQTEETMTNQVPESDATEAKDALDSQAFDAQALNIQISDVIAQAFAAEAPKTPDMIAAETSRSDPQATVCTKLSFNNSEHAVLDEDDGIANSPVSFSGALTSIVEDDINAKVCAGNASSEASAVSLQPPSPHLETGLVSDVSLQPPSPHLETGLVSDVIAAELRELEEDVKDVPDLVPPSGSEPFAEPLAAHAPQKEAEVVVTDMLGSAEVLAAAADEPADSGSAEAEDTACLSAEAQETLAASADATVEQSKEVTNFETPEKLVATTEATEQDGHNRGVPQVELGKLGSFKSIACWITGGKKEPNQNAEGMKVLETEGKKTSNEKADGKDVPKTQSKARKTPLTTGTSQGDEETPLPKKKRQSTTRKTPPKSHGDEESPPPKKQRPLKKQ
jgi:hypothetical protein